jgi:hypothetical protein
MTDLEQAQSVLRFLMKQRIQLECEMLGETFDPVKFEETFQYVSGTTDWNIIIDKMAKSVKENA